MEPREIPKREISLDLLERNIKSAVPTISKEEGVVPLLDGVGATKEQLIRDLYAIAQDSSSDSIRRSAIRDMLEMHGVIGNKNNGDIHFNIVMADDVKIANILSKKE